MASEQERATVDGDGERTAPRDGTRPFFFDVAAIDEVSLEESVAHLDPSIDREEFFATFGRNLYTRTILRDPTLHVTYARVDAGEKVKPHRHGTHQLTFVTKGELRYGNRVAGPGMGYFTPDMPYSWTAGPDGAEWLEIHSATPQVFVSGRSGRHDGEA